MIELVKGQNVPMPESHARKFVIWEKNGNWGVDNTETNKSVFKGSFHLASMVVYSMNVNHYKTVPYVK